MTPTLTISDPLAAGAYTLTATSAPAPTPAPVPAPFEGANLESNSDYNRARYFVDIAKSFRQRGTPDAPYSGKCPVNANGEPTQDCSTVFFTDRGSEIAGDYIFTWDGGGTAKISSPNSKNKVTSQIAGEAKVTLVGGNITITVTGTANGIRNPHFLPASYNGDPNAFDPAFLTMLKKFDAFRAMDLAQTNFSMVTNWADRAMPSDATYAWRGWPWERIIDLANAVGRDCYINVPALATDDYVKTLGVLVRGRINAGLNCYVEYSNEVWNGTFKAAQQNLDLTRQAIAAGDTSLNIGGTDHNEIYCARRRYLKRAAEITTLLGPGPFRMVWATQVNGGWGDGPGGWAAQMDWCRKYIGQPKDIFYAVAGAPYLSPGKDSTGKDWTKNTPITCDQIIARLQDRAAAMGATDGQKQLAALAKSEGVVNIGYENGIDLGQYATDIPAKDQSSEDPRIRKVVSDYLSSFYGTGAMGCFIFALTGRSAKAGYWQFTTDATRLDAPKLLGAMDVKDGLAQSGGAR
jgi:hypothetical protein